MRAGVCTLFRLRISLFFPSWLAAALGIMAHHNAHPLPAITREDIPLQAEFFGEPVHPISVSFPSTTNFNANNHAKQLNIMNLNITPTTTPTPHIGQITAFCPLVLWVSRRLHAIECTTDEARLQHSLPKLTGFFSSLIALFRIVSQP